MAILALAIFLISYIGVALGRIPGLMLDRTGIALIGAILMIVCNIVPFDDIARAIDFPTIILLYALIMVSAHRHTRHPYFACDIDRVDLYNKAVVC